jgi:hypothetical protein
MKTVDITAEVRQKLKEEIDRRARKRAVREERVSRSYKVRTFGEQPQPRNSTSKVRLQRAAERQRKISDRKWEAEGLKPNAERTHVTCTTCGKTTKKHNGKGTRHHVDCPRATDSHES